MKNKVFFIAVGLFLSILFGCAPTMDVEWTKEQYQFRKFNKIAIIAITKNLELRKSLEEGIISNLKENNKGDIEVITGLSLLPPNVSEENWKEENISKLLEENSIDGLITVSVVDSYTSTDYQSGSVYTYPRYYRAGRHVYRTYSTVYDSGSYEQKQNFVIEADVYDLHEGNEKSEILVWKGQKTIDNFSSIKSLSNIFSKSFVEYVIEKGIIK